MIKKLLAIVGILAVLSPYVTFAAYATNSLDLELSSSQHVSRADNALLEPGSAYTVECWINNESLIGGGANAYVIASKGTSTGNQRSFVLKVSNDGANNISLVTQTSSAGSGYDGGTSVTWTATPSNATWYHVAWTLSGATEKYYVDDAQMGASQTSAISSLFDSTGSFGFGAENISGTPASFFDGQLSLCRVWQTVRTLAEISTNKCSILGSTTGLSGEWVLDNALTDNSGNSLTLSNINSATFLASVPACAGGGGSITGETYIQSLEN